MRCYGWIFICYGCFKTQWQPWIKCNVSINNHKTQICRTLLVELSSWETCAVSQFFKLFQMPKKSLLKSRYTKNIIATLSYPKNIRIKNFASPKILWSSPSLETFKVLPPPCHTPLSQDPKVDFLHWNPPARTDLSLKSRFLNPVIGDFTMKLFYLITKLLGMDEPSSPL